MQRGIPTGAQPFSQRKCGVIELQTPASALLAQRSMNTYESSRDETDMKSFFLKPDAILCAENLGVGVSAWYLLMKLAGHVFFVGPAAAQQPLS